jgi:hypothetical protein
MFKKNGLSFLYFAFNLTPTSIDSNSHASTKISRESIASQRTNSRSSRSNSGIRKEPMARSVYGQNKSRSNKGLANRNRNQLLDDEAYVLCNTSTSNERVSRSRT